MTRMIIRRCIRHSMRIGLLVLLAACDRSPESSYGFVLPEGDAAAGEETFVRLHCNDCHAVKGRGDLREGIDPIMTVTIGGKRTRIDTYGELVTSVINPSHKISHRYMDEIAAKDGMSTMRNYNDVMTVFELINLVAFLQAQYELQPYVGPSYQSQPDRTDRPEE